MAETALVAGARVRRLALRYAGVFGVALGALGCSAEDGGNAKAGDDLCVPSRQMYDEAVDAMLTTHCRSCHGATPTYGAPTTFGDYDALIAGKEGSRAIDRMLTQVVNKTMPPVGTPAPPHEVQDTLATWLSCGAAHPDHSVGLTSSAPVFAAPEQPPTGAKTEDLLAPEFEVGPKTLDLYQCFSFDAPVSEDAFVQRIEAVVDDARVVHHIVLLKDPKKRFDVGPKVCKGMPADSQYLYAWAPGAGAVAFPEGGLRIKPGDRYIVQIHYNNGAGAENVADSSGIRLWLGPVQGPEYGMFAPGPLAFAIPPGPEFAATGTCKVKERLELLAGMPHMHELGRAFEQKVVRKDGTVEPLIAITGWSFELQPFYHTPAVLEVGDRLLTTCTWQHDGAEQVPFGSGTADEMCFNFLFATPPPGKPYCDNFELDPNASVDYSVGACAPEGADPAPKQVKTPLSFEAAPKAEGGVAEDARWELTEATLYLPKITLNYIAPESFVLGRGQAFSTADGTLTLDATSRAMVALKGGQGLDATEKLSRSGKLVPTKDGFSLEPTCGAEAAMALRVGVEGDVLTVIGTRKVSGFDVPAVYRFSRAAK
ncbi:MAG: hypothetical protein H6747_09325 [Deltaproteobacteria bacterium]|nr:hypothetical protein [Deltaproteobacteria bacterium]